MIQLGTGTGGQALFTLNGVPAEVAPGGNISGMSVQLAQAFSVPIQAVATITFTPYTNLGNGLLSLPDGYMDPALQFVDSSGKEIGLNYGFTIPAGSTVLALPTINAGTVLEGSW